MSAMPRGRCATEADELDEFAQLLPCIDPSRPRSAIEWLDEASFALGVDEIVAAVTMRRDLRRHPRGWGLSFSAGADAAAGQVTLHGFYCSNRVVDEDPFRFAFQPFLLGRGEAAKASQVVASARIERPFP